MALRKVRLSRHGTPRKNRETWRTRRGKGVCDEEGWKAGSGSGASAAYRSPLWLRRGEGVSEEFQALGAREHTTLGKTKGRRLNIPALRFAIGRATRQMEECSP